MPSFTKALKSQVGRKILSSITGLGLILYIILHLVGNLNIFGSAHAFNLYTHQLVSLGWILYVLEILLLGAILVHAYIGISVWLKRRKSRPEAYREYQSKGGPSHQTWSSKSMIFTGIILLVFMVLHVIQFKYGDAGTTQVQGMQIRDLKSLVISAFQNPWYAFGYGLVMIALGFHLAHGLWSAITDLSMRHKKFSKFIYGFSIVFAVVMAFGFLFIPMYIYFTGGA